MGRRLPIKWTGLIMTIEQSIENRYTGEAIFTADINCSEDEPLSVRIGLAVKIAVSEKTDLRRADLREADLSGANLRWADLRYYKSDLYECFIQTEYMQVGCERHSWDDWESFDDKSILEMDGKKALEWWHENKPILIAIRNNIKVKNND